MIEINDKRLKKDFKGITFSKYKKSDAKKELLNSMLNSCIEPACFWSAEFICSGHFLELWEIIIYFISFHIHLGNPKLPMYIDMRMNIFIDIIRSGYLDNELLMRNNIKIRKLFAEVICVLTLSNKKNTYNIPKINDNHYNFINISNMLKADDIKYAKGIYYNNDPKELFISVNEFAWNIHKKNILKSIFWIEWLLGYETKCLKNKIKFKAARREMPVDSKFQLDIIWIIWDILLKESKKKSVGIYKIISSLLNIFCLKYNQNTKRKRKFILYFAISLLTETYNTNIKIINDTKTVSNVVDNIDMVYKQIKKNEETPGTDYLFNNSFTNNAKNLETTIKKLEIMNKLNYNK